jgi:nitrite reductase (NADH) large subunit
MTAETSNSVEKQDLVVIGNGMAGARAVEEILERGGGAQFRITMFGDEPYGNYNRIMLSHVLAGEDSEEIYLNPLDWYAENEITLHAGVRVVRVDRFSKKVYGNDGSIESYDKLIIATGSRTFYPPMDGMWVDDKTLTPGVFGFRTLDDTTAMLDYAAERRTAVVIGGGLLGLEAAYGLMQHGHEVHVVQSGPVLMNQQLDEEAGGILRKVLERMGMTVHTGKRTTAIRAHGGGVSAVVFKDGSAIDCDMVVLTAGIRPNVGLGVVSGLTVERAIVTDDQMRSVDDPDIYAVGECAQHRGEVYGLVAPLWEQAVVLADHITGVNPKAAYHGSRIATKLKVAGVDVASMGVKGPERPDDEFVRFAEPKRGVYKSVVIRDGKLIGAMLLGDTKKVAFLTQSFDRGLPLPEERVEMLFELAGPSEEQGAAEMDDSVQVCNCNGVSKGDLVACVRGGEHSVTGCMNATRAGKGCGACKPLVRDIVEWAVTESGGEVGEDQSANWYVPAIPMDKPTLIAAIKEQNLRSVSAVLAALAPEGEDAGSKMPLTSLLRVVWNGEFVNENDAKFINDRVHANIQRDGTFSVVPQIKGRDHHLQRAAPDRRRRRQVRRPDDQDHRRAADRPARRAQGGPAGRVGGPRHALGLRLRQVLPHGEELRRHGLLPLRAGRLDDARGAHRADLPGAGEPGEDEAGRGRLPAQLLGGAGQGRRGGRCRRRPVGRAHRRRGRGLGSPRRRAGDRGRARRSDPARRGVHAVLPRERQVAGAQLRLRPAGRAGRAQGDPGRRP